MQLRVHHDSEYPAHIERAMLVCRSGSIKGNMGRNIVGDIYKKFERSHGHIAA